MCAAGTCAVALAVPGVAVAQAPSQSDYQAIKQVLSSSKAYRADHFRIMSADISPLEGNYARVDVRTARGRGKDVVLARSGSDWAITAYGTNVWARCTGAPGAVIDALFGEANCAPSEPTAPVVPVPVVTSPSIPAAGDLPASVLATDGTLIKDPARPEIYVLYGGAKFLTNAALLAPGARTGLRVDQVRMVTASALSRIPTVPADGTVLKEQANGQIWLVAGGARFAVPSDTVLQRLGHEPSQARIIAHGDIAQIPTAPRDGSLLREYDSSGPVLVLGGATLAITTQGLASIGRSAGDVQVVPNSTLASLGTVPRDGVLLREPTNSPTFVLAGGAAVGIPSLASLRALGKDVGDVTIVPTGTISRFPMVPRDGSVLREPSSARLAVIAGGARFVAPAGYAVERLGRDSSQVLTIPDGSLANLPSVPRDDTLIREGATGNFTLFTAGAQFPVPANFDLRLLGRAGGQAVVVPEGTAAALPITPRDGSVVRGAPSGQLWVFSGGTRQATNSVPGGSPQNVTQVPDPSLTRFPMALRDGTFVKPVGDNSTLAWVIVGGARFSVPITAISSLGYPDAQVNVISAAMFAGIGLVPRDLTVLQEVGSGSVYLVAGGGRLPVPNRSGLPAIGIGATSVMVIPAGGLSQIPTLPRSGTLLKEPSSPTIWQMIGTVRRAVPPGTGHVVLVPDGSLAVIPIG